MAFPCIHGKSGSRWASDVGDFIGNHERGVGRRQGTRLESFTEHGEAYGIERPGASTPQEQEDADDPE